jgi:hypothetical protein
MIRTDSQGNELWSRAFDSENNILVSSGLQTADGNYLMSGACASTGETDYFMVDFLFIKIDSEGNEIWRNIFGDSTITDRAIVVSQTSDSGYIAVGGVANIRLIKIDGSGQSLWEQAIENGTSNTHNAFASILQHQDGGYIVAGSVIVDTSNIFLVKTDANGNIGQ